MANNTRQNMPKYTRWEQLPILMDIPMICVVFDMAESTVKRLVAQGEFPGARKIGDQWRFDRETLHNYFVREGGK